MLHFSEHSNIHTVTPPVPLCDTQCRRAITFVDEGTELWSQREEGLGQPRMQAPRRGRWTSLTLTILVPAAQCVEGFPPQDDLLGDDAVAVHVSFLGDAGLAEVLRGGPQVCEFSIEIAEWREQSGP